MIRTQIYLPEQLYKTVQLVAKQEKRSLAEIVRQLLLAGLTQRQPRRSIGTALRRLATVHGEGPADLSTNLDTYLYGDE